MREEDTTTEKRLKVTLDAATDKEQSARESGRRLQKRLVDAKSDLERLNEERRANLIASEQAIATAEKRLATLNAEYAELQRTPTANSAEYSVRTRELEFEISDAAPALRSAREDLPQTDRETQRAIDEAIAAVAAAETSQRPRNPSQPQRPLSMRRRPHPTRPVTHTARQKRPLRHGKRSCGSASGTRRSPSSRRIAL